MGKPVFVGEAAFLNGTEIGQLLLDISQVRLEHEPSDPQCALMMRVQKYADDQAAQCQHMTALDREYSGHLLRTRGWLERLARVQEKPKHVRVLEFLRGLFKLEKNAVSSAQEQSFQQAA